MTDAGVALVEDVAWASAGGWQGQKEDREE